MDTILVIPSQVEVRHRDVAWSDFYEKSNVKVTTVESNVDSLAASSWSSRSNSILNEKSISSSISSFPDPQNSTAVTHELSTADMAYSPQNYMGIMLALPVEATDHSAAISAIESGARAMAKKWPVLAGRLQSTKSNSYHVTVSTATPAGTNNRIPLEVVEHGQSSTPFPYSYRQFKEQGFPSALCHHSSLLDSVAGSDLLGQDKPTCKLRANFIKGGMLLIFYLHHTIADGYTFASISSVFLKGMAGQTKNSDLGTSLRDEALENSLKPGDPTELLQQCPELIVDDSAHGYEDFRSVPQGTKTCIFRFPAARLLLLHQKMKKKAVSVFGPKAFLTINDCMSAMIWAHVAKARQLDPLKKPTSRLFFPIDFRKRLNPKVPSSYFGNAVLTGMATIDVATLLAASDGETGEIRAVAMVKVASAIREGVAKVDHDYVITRLRLAKSIPDVRNLHRAFDADGNEDVLLTSYAGASASFDTYVPSLQCDRPDAVRIAFPIPHNGVGHVLPMTQIGLKAVVEVQLALFEPDMERLCRDEEWLDLFDEVITPDGIVRVKSIVEKRFRALTDQLAAILITAGNLSNTKKKAKPRTGSVGTNLSQMKVG